MEKICLKFGSYKYFYYICNVKLKKNIMTRFESNVYDFVESIFGEEVAVNNFRFCRKAAGAFMFMCYCFTLPFEFIKLVLVNLKEKGVI